MSCSQKRPRPRYETIQDVNDNCKNIHSASNKAHKKLPNQSEKPNKRVDDDLSGTNRFPKRNNSAQSSLYENHNQVLRKKYDISGRCENNESKSRLTTFCKLLSSNQLNISNKSHDNTSENVNYHFPKEMKQSVEGNSIMDQFNRGIMPDVVSTR